ncbi:MAG: hypothetical protein ABI791_11985 [Acidobacteriota bacterium]
MTFSFRQLNTSFAQSGRSISQPSEPPAPVPGSDARTAPAKAGRQKSFFALAALCQIMPCGQSCNSGIVW